MTNWAAINDDPPHDYGDSYATIKVGVKRRPRDNLGARRGER
ncbi:MAG: hypothetical protein WKF73_12320 [Nocardioidaceae bacterium]